jgi:hypothetical protein
MFTSFSFSFCSLSFFLTSSLSDHEDFGEMTTTNTSGASRHVEQAMKSLTFLYFFRRNTSYPWLQLILLCSVEYNDGRLR